MCDSKLEFIKPRNELPSALSYDPERSHGGLATQIFFD